MTINESNPDPFGFREELEEALSSPELDAFGETISTEPAGGWSADTRRAAYAVAVALGRCRLFGVDAENLDGTLPAAMAVAAAEELATHLGGWIDDARNLGQRWNEANDSTEAEEYCLELLEARMEALAAWIAIDEAYAYCLDNSEPEAARFPVDQLLSRIGEFDETLEANKLLLATAAETELLNNWRTFLAAPYCEVLPWWLSGNLEAIAVENWERMIREWPSAVAWDRLRQVGEGGAIAPARQVHSRDALPRVVRMAAALTSIPPRLYWWNSPDGRYAACLAIPEQVASDQAELVLRIITMDDEPALDLKGEGVWLASVPAIIDEQGQARFCLADLLQTPQDLRLEVGTGRTVWQAVES